MAQTPIGAITGLHGELLCGWAFDPSQPDQRLVIEIQLDGQPLTVARADQWQPAQPSSSLPGDGCHGFCIPLMSRWLQRGRRLSAWVANRGILLEGQIDLGARPEAKAAPPVAEVRFDGGLRLLGWIWDPLEPNRHVRVRAYEHARCLADTLADRPHPALIDRPTADHGFILDLPWTLADGQRHRITLVDDQGQPLPGGRVTICYWPDGLSGLLRQSLPAGTEPERAQRALLLAVADHQERIAPKALSFADYPHWQKLHEQPEPLPAAQSPLRVGVLIYDVSPDVSPQVSNKPGTESCLGRSRASLARQRWSPLAVRACTEEAMLSALAQLLAAGCEVVTLLRCGDALAPQAIDALVTALRAEASAPVAKPTAKPSAPEPAWVYADSDRDDGGGRGCDPWLKPAWDPDLFFGIDLISSGCLFPAALLRQALQLLEAELAPRGIGLSLHWLLAAVVAVTLEQRLEVAHLPRVLYRRAAAASPATAEAPLLTSGIACDRLSGVDAARRQPALQWLAERLAPGARVEPCSGHPALSRVIWPLPAQLPTVTCIVPTRDRVDLLRPCIEGLLGQTDYPQLEIIVIDNGSCCPKTRAYLAELPARGVRVLDYPHPFNFSTMNNLAVSMARGELLCLLNNDVLVREAQWLKAMVRELLRPGIGAVGAKLLWPNAMVQHGGVILGIHGLAAHVGNQWQIHDAGYLGFNQVTRRYSAVTAACLLLRRALYQELGGLNAVDFPVTFNDVDLCLRIRARGLALVWTPFARLEHLESASRGRDEEPAQAGRARREQERLRARWCSLREADPAYHPALAHDLWSGPYGALHLNPASRAPRVVAPAPIPSRADPA